MERQFIRRHNIAVYPVASYLPRKCKSQQNTDAFEPYFHVLEAIPEDYQMIATQRLARNTFVRPLYENLRHSKAMKKASDRWLIVIRKLKLHANSHVL